MTLRMGSLFAGIGGFDLGFHRAGFVPTWAVEIDPACQRVLRHHFPGLHIESDVREVGAHNLEPVDVITFGFPCQDLSVAGKRKGLRGERSGLYWDALRVISELRPAIAIAENVSGLLSSHGGRDMAAVLWGLGDIGAIDIGWRTLDAQYFGVAQRRRRVFVVADFRERRAAEILALADGLSGHPAPRREARERTAATLTCGLASSSGQDIERNDVPLSCYGITDDETAAENLLPTMSLPSATGGGRPPATAYALQGAGHTSQGSQGSGWNEERCFTLNTTDVHGDAVNVTPIAFQQNQRDEVRDMDDVAGALPAQPGMKQQNYIAVRMAVRRLTPTECERLQGFPDGWTAVDGAADSTRYRQLGNAVAVPVAEWLGHRIADHADGLRFDTSGRLVGWAF